MAGLGSLLSMMVYLYSFVILARVLMSWVQVDPSSPLARTIFNLTEPVLAPVRNLLPQGAGLDFSPIIVMILLQFVAQFLMMMFS